MVVRQDSRWVLLFGYSGNTAMRPDWPLDRCADIVLARVYPQLSRGGAMRVGYGRSRGSPFATATGSSYIDTRPHAKPVATPAHFS
jgi:hypothetical protein